ncbi:hypothetical protein KP509_21G089900 [Ceratopteris richardii]|uniref:Auxin response factor n=2 Tax=Ceratopteris richardii TaxID=49495 RepID=A0A8T2SFT0_CERRI|nr:hypothetical protein KP509_21G089900 [Ceratopteris richardii]
MHLDSQRHVSLGAAHHLPGSLLERCAETTTLDKNEMMYSELWHACAGPLVCLPRQGSRVVYCPQGHLEQVAASVKQGFDMHIPVCDIPPQIMCRVVDLSLHADRETDDVFAQFTLLPLLQEDDKGLDADPASPPKMVTHSFSKILTISDTSTHGGFSVPRRAADECFPPLDYTQQRPSQELVARDLHGVEWRFRHIFRGQPRRHLLTTGWSVFVSTKRLVAGDTVLFLRGKKGEIWLGIRRSSRPPSCKRMSVLPSQSMHMGVLAAAAHALSTKTMFNVYYNPRTSPAEFVIPHQKYRKAFVHSLSVGMRFKMRSESEDGTEKRYTGTITGTGDIDPERWRDSKWRSLKVNWDEHSTTQLPDRVSPWEIEPFLATGALDLPIHIRGLKSYWTTYPSSSVSSSVELTRSGSLRCSGDPFSSLRYSTNVLQAHENLPLRDPHGFKGGAKSKPPLPDHRAMNDPFAEVKRLRNCQTYASGGLERKCEYAVEKKISRELLGLVEDEGSSLFESNFEKPFGLSLLRSQQPLNATASQTPIFPKPELESLEDSKSLIWRMLDAKPSQNHSTTQLEVSKLPKSSSHSEISAATSRIFKASHDEFLHNSLVEFNSSTVENNVILTAGESSTEEDAKKPLNNGVRSTVRLFGFPLRELNTLSRMTQQVCPAGVEPPVTSAHKVSPQINVGERDELDHGDVQPSYHKRRSPSAWCEDGLGPEFRACKPKLQSTFSASKYLIKVMKKGHHVGRSVDLSKFDGYSQLFCALDELFQMEGELNDPSKGWQMTYTDKEGDIMLVGDDPWEQFVDLAKRICISTREDNMQTMPSDAVKTSSTQSRSAERVLADSSEYQDSSAPTEISFRNSISG